MDQAEAVLRLSTAQYQQILDHCLRELPREGCGILGGVGDKVSEVCCLPNVAENDHRYLAAPEHQLAAFRFLEEQQLELVAVFHSHPSGEAYPSGLDIKQAHYPHSFYLIIGLRNPSQPERRAFRIVDCQVQEVELIIGKED